MEDERRIRTQLSAWRIEETPDGMAERIARHVTALPQRRPWWMSLMQGLQNGFSDWHAGMTYKLAGLAVCAMIGLASGLNQEEYGALDVDALAFSGEAILEGI